ncbi:hypothetical protein CEXT_249101 [Caerostris extrusa]|uniref:Uncharacterized protein n=1 Tax=Caerostris extrusa TaxID=172846 RepID=A0AAV4PM09_CAEEX|nr:hypothetical protein CEXT_249101 [Caerostris extrusa]
MTRRGPSRESPSHNSVSIRVPLMHCSVDGYFICYKSRMGSPCRTRNPMVWDPETGDPGDLLTRQGRPEGVMPEMGIET